MDSYMKTYTTTIHAAVATANSFSLSSTGLDQITEGIYANINGKNKQVSISSVIDLYGETVNLR